MKRPDCRGVTPVALGFDTSAYTTSAAAVDHRGRVLADVRRVLDVKQGDRGLRQSQALFQHIVNLPEITEELFAKLREQGVVGLPEARVPAGRDDGDGGVNAAAACATDAARVPAGRDGEGGANAAAAPGSDPACGSTSAGRDGLDGSGPAAGPSQPGIAVVAVSSRPRPVDGSYMPVFLGGLGTARAVAAALAVPCCTFSHQEGHIAAAAGALDPGAAGLAFHLSGGTGEIVTTAGCRPGEIVGGTRDLSFGQLIDRAGVALGLGFPAGAALDRLACANRDAVAWHWSSRGRRVYEAPALGEIRVQDCYANLSGIETSCQRAIEQGVPPERLAPELFFRISDAIRQMLLAAARKTGRREIILMGGVAASAFLRQELADLAPRAAQSAGTAEYGAARPGENEPRDAQDAQGVGTAGYGAARPDESEPRSTQDAQGAGTAGYGAARPGESAPRSTQGARGALRVHFGTPALSSDNAVGIARLGMQQYLAGETPENTALKG